MARPKEMLSLASIADETGISYATLRNYALKYSEEIPSEGVGRSTRYPRAAVKVFQRLRKESKPGRKPRSASLLDAPAPVPAAPAPVPAPMPVRYEAPPVQRSAATDTSGMERELSAIRSFLERIATSLEQLASEPRSAAPAPVAAPASVAVAPVAAERPEAPAPEAPEKKGVALPPLVGEVREMRDPGGHRRLHSLPKVMGQRGKRPE